MDRGDTRSSLRRARVPALVAVVAVVGAVVVAVSGAASRVPGVRFLPAGNWVYNTIMGAAFHVDGGTGNIDARIDVAAGPGAQVVQGDTAAVVVSDDIHRFNQAELEVVETVPAPVDETPVALEAPGGPYLAYLDAGIIVRYGEVEANVRLTGPLSRPVVTADGTLWVHRGATSSLCRLAGESTEADCSVPTPQGATGALTTIADEPVFLDLSANAMHAVDGGGLGAAVPLGVDLPDTAQPAATDVAGRVAVLDPANSRVHIVGAAAPPTSVDLPPGDYTAPASTGEVFAVVDREDDTLLVFDGAGAERTRKPLPPEGGEPTLAAGQDGRLYVKGGEGEHVVIVDRGGDVTDVPVDGVDVTTTPTRDTTTAGEDPTTTSTTVTTTTPTRVEPTTRIPPPVAPPSPPGAPPGVRAIAGDGSATVTWQAAAANRGPITGYRVSWPGGSTTVGPNVRQARAGGLTNGTRYVLTVAAVNAAGVGPGTQSNPVVPAGPAAAPRDLVVDAASGEATLTWAAPAMGGGRFVHYRVSATGVAARTVTGTSVVLSGLPTDRDVTFAVRAVTEVNGRNVDGAAASAVVRAPRPVITVTRGRTEGYDGCEVPECGYMLVTMTGFEPDTHYEVEVYATSDYTNPGRGTTTDGEGKADFEAFPFEGVGEQVWVEATLDGEVVARSARYTWRSG
ncbi:fibronectin type III domain-containing protein [Actinokineospora sp. UTMC 2448]|uniref:fibronectin type III domain-containing protein n=1 Tax=Actinokineospora sp. UTMC 2448 TaxID=2268449 RepID=UPI002164E7A9|nr:fibronectin type III domain-containing protein [Actinokineospora sp. UTMC 2448]UVS79274.1 Fibronectin type III domain protein [Actinokineospora sp. UTMC 2448]